MIIFFNFSHSLSFAVIRGHSWSFVIIHGYSWSLVCTFRHDSQSRVKAVENIPCNNPIWNERGFAGLFSEGVS